MLFFFFYSSIQLWLREVTIVSLLQNYSGADQLSCVQAGVGKTIFICVAYFMLIDCSLKWLTKTKSNKWPIKTGMKNNERSIKSEQINQRSWKEVELQQWRRLTQRKVFQMCRCLDAASQLASLVELGESIKHYQCFYVWCKMNVKYPQSGRSFSCDFTDTGLRSG